LPQKVIVSTQVEAIVNMRVTPIPVSVLEKKDKKRQLIAVLLIAILVRVGCMVWSWSGYYFAGELNELSKNYFREGYSIAAGYGYVRGDGKAVEYFDSLYGHILSENFRINPDTAGPLPAEGVEFQMLHPPGMALLIAGMHSIFAIRSDMPIQIIGIILDTIAVGLVYWMSYTFFGLRVGFAASLTYALFPPLIYYSSAAKLPDGLLSVFICGSVACVLKAIYSKGRHEVSWYGASGLMLGLGSYLRPDYMLMPLFMGLGLWLYTWRFWRSFAAMALAQVVVFLVLFPWAYRNHNICGRWVFTSSSVGATLITGLGEFHNPWGFGYTDGDRQEQAQLQGFASAWGPEADLYFRKLFFQSVQQQPMAYLKSIIYRLPLALMPSLGWGYANPYKTQSFTKLREAGMDRYQAITHEFKYILEAYWDMLAISVLSFCNLLFVFVLFFKEQKQYGLILLLLSPHIYSILSHILTHMEPRLLLPSIFSWLIALGYVLARGWQYRHALDQYPNPWASGASQVRY
jgi:4-amino-4-deoxy-L-arabinose transferase-like glycosyltransferase